jgi:hypothetical protein
VICAGELNPRLERALHPDLRPQMLRFLQTLPQAYSNVSLVSPDQMPSQSEADYEDLTHINAAARERYTAALIEQLKPLLTEKR